MTYLDSVFNLVLSMLKSAVSDGIIGAIFYIYLIVQTLLLFIQIIRNI